VWVIKQDNEGESEREREREIIKNRYILFQIVVLLDLMGSFRSICFENAKKILGLVVQTQLSFSLSIQTRNSPHTERLNNIFFFFFFHLPIS
jgi:hypothetical protein